MKKRSRWFRDSLKKYDDHFVPQTNVKHEGAVSPANPRAKGKNWDIYPCTVRVRTDPEKVKAITEPKAPKNVQRMYSVGDDLHGKISHLAMLGGPLRTPTNWNSMDLGLSTGESILTTKGISYDIASIVILWRREANNCIYRCKQLLLGRSATPGTQRLLETCCILLANPH